MERLYFIVNPIAGMGRSAKAFGRVRELLRQRGADFDAVYTEYAGHAIALTRAALDAGEKRIVAVGGDGTVSEVASVLCASGVVMGILPFGTGNDLCRTLGLPTEPEAALEVLLAGCVYPLDAGMANDRFFLNAAGFGFDVDVLRRAEKFKKRFTGMLPYLLGVIQTLFCLRVLPMTIRIGETVQHLDGIVLVVGNGRYFGGGMKPTPHADPFDGKFDVCIAKKMPLYRYIPVLSRFVKGQHLDLPEMLYFQVDELTVETPSDEFLDLDGEVCGSVPVTFRLLPGAISLLVRS
ncbi:MAG: diacylglycerol kinase family protein [Candidatus Pelethousia sp.]|nr:diacylglycerol kinase family protein [Candidatus Pelethousia sp.]